MRGEGAIRVPEYYCPFPFLNLLGLQSPSPSDRRETPQVHKKRKHCRQASFRLGKVDPEDPSAQCRSAESESTCFGSLWFRRSAGHTRTPYPLLPGAETQITERKLHDCFQASRHCAIFVIVVGSTFLRKATVPLLLLPLLGFTFSGPLEFAHPIEEPSPVDVHTHTASAADTNLVCAGENPHENHNCLHAQQFDPVLKLIPGPRKLACFQTPNSRCPRQHQIVHGRDTPTSRTSPELADSKLVLSSSFHFVFSLGGVYSCFSDSQFVRSDWLSFLHFPYGERFT